MCSADIFLAVLAFLFPPLPVWVKRGICSADSVINILLCVLGFIPGLIHAWYIIARYPEPPYEYEALANGDESGRITYVYVQAPQGYQTQQPPKPHRGGGDVNYGTNSAPATSSRQEQQQKQQHQQQQQQQGVTDAGEGSSHHEGVPPSYAEVVAGDHKVQTQD